MGHDERRTRVTAIRIVVVDDHPIVRAGLQGLLATQPDFDIVGEAVNGKDAIDVVARTRPDVVTMDLRMPELEGVGAIRAIKAAHPEVHVLVLTTYDTDAEILRAVEAGATGYLLKETPRDELFRAVRATARGESALSPSVATRLVVKAGAPEEQELSQRELEVLELVARGTSNKIIARDLRISEATVKTHLLHIFGKLQVDDRTAAVTVALERGVLRLDRGR
jgi:DNA-binding NarL/FixJ family response regulator